MLLDARSVESGALIETDLCIVGGGAAGITLAREFVNANTRVTLLESGGTDFEADAQALYTGSNIGRDYQDTTVCRLRYLGGTTNHWGGWCLPLEPIDMQEREGVRYSGWPFDRTHLEPWYRRAQDVCQLGPFEYAPSRWGLDTAKAPAPFHGPHFTTKLLQEGPPTRFGTAYRVELQQAPRVTVYLHANVLKFATDDSGREIQEVQAGTLAGNRFRVRAKAYILATGGIENARLLLLSGPPHGKGLGNENDLVGRFFMVHLLYSGAEIALSDPHSQFELYTGRNSVTFNGFGAPHQFVSFVGLSPQAMTERKLPGMNIQWFYRFKPVVDAVNALKRLLDGESPAGRWPDVRAVLGDIDGLAGFAVRKALLGQGVPVESLMLNCVSEQSPNPDSRIRLGDDVDALGLRRVAVDWRLTAADKQNALSTLRLLSAEVGRTAFGRLQMALDDSDEIWPPDMRGDEHHMGTTRMHRDPAYGVVDEHCRVHATSNLYIAGSSVFPTSSSANPTLTIVALALRLADHLKAKLALASLTRYG